MLNNPKILYVDDEEDLLLLAQSFFEDENLTIDISADFDQALEKIHLYDYDIVITDAKMPKGSGQESFLPDEQDLPLCYSLEYRRFSGKGGLRSRESVYRFWTIVSYSNF